MQAAQATAVAARAAREAAYVIMRAGLVTEQADFDAERAVFEAKQNTLRDDLGALALEEAAASAEAQLLVIRDHFLDDLGTFVETLD